MANFSMLIAEKLRDATVYIIVVLMLVHCLRRLTSIKAALAERLCLAVYVIEVIYGIHQ